MCVCGGGRVETEIDCKPGGPAAAVPRGGGGGNVYACV